MTISYHWLSEFLPEQIEPERLSRILTSIGLEVESMEAYESIRGGLMGVMIGEVLTCEQHPNADKLKITTVNIGADAPLQVVCGAANVAAGQKVAVATVGTTIYPTEGEPLTMKVAKIRGVESHGMICAEDELGLGSSHAGIMVLPDTLVPGTPAAEYFEVYQDWVYEIGLTPNRMDAMSHLGVARDVCAYLTHHNKQETRPKQTYANGFKADTTDLPIAVRIDNPEACARYAGVSISGVTVQPSPAWLKNKLQAIGVRPINNIVDVTNYILHETGQPLHAFDAAAISGNQVIVRCLEEGTAFITLDDKERKLSAEDLMICDGNNTPMCIGGVFGGAKSGVQDTTTAIFLESAWFHPVSIRKSSMRHGLRTDAATRFEKGVDISNTVNVLKRAALLIKEVAGGNISSDVVDVYPTPKEKTEVALKYHFLKKLSGKNYHPDAVKRILTSLGFEIAKEGMDEIRLTVPYHKPDISLPADIVEEILRIDGLDSIDIPVSITISPSVEAHGWKESLKEKIAGYLTGQGFHEILTNSITNSKYFDEATLGTTVKMLNNLSADLDVLRPSMLQSGLECIAYNINRKNTNLQLFEFGKTYATSGPGDYSETAHLAVYITGNNHEDNWHEKAAAHDFYRLKGLAAAIPALAGISDVTVKAAEQGHDFDLCAGKQVLGKLSIVSGAVLKGFDIRQQVYFLDIDLAVLFKLAAKHKITYAEVSKFPAVQRDLAMVVNRSTTYAALEQVVKQTKISRLTDMRLFDVFESDKLGADKKSMAISFTFLDEEKTMTDKEIDTMVGKLIQAFEKELGAEIRK